MALSARAMARPLGAFLSHFVLSRYLLASICALAVDFTLFMLLSRFPLPPALWAIGGYSGGLAVHWLLSVHFVFVLERRPSHAQRIGFVISALAGLAITTALVDALSASGLKPAMAKLLTIPVSFLSVYAIRKYGVFNRS